jgi:single-strand DNA-binding protein
MSVNKAIILGRLGKDVELKYTGSQKAVASFSVATSESYTDKSGQKQESTEWHNVEVWGKLAELCKEYLQKGSECYVEGSIKTESYEKNGEKKYITKLVARTVQFLGKPEKTTMAERSNGAPF